MRIGRSLCLFLTITSISRCAALQDVQNALVNLKRLQFKLDSVQPGMLAGVDLTKISDPASFDFYDKLLNLALSVAGKQGSTARLSLHAKPSVTVAGIPLEYPDEITILDKQFTNP